MSRRKAEWGIICTNIKGQKMETTKILKKQNKELKIHVKELAKMRKKELDGIKKAKEKIKKKSRIKKQTLKIDKNRFIDWYYSDWGRSALTDVQADIIDELKGSPTGTCIISIKNLSEQLCYLPIHLIINKEIIEEGIDEIEEPSEKYNLRFV